jgi:hypothetical protein
VVTDISSFKAVLDKQKEDIKESITHIAEAGSHQTES